MLCIVRMHGYSGPRVAAVAHRTPGGCLLSGFQSSMCGWGRPITQRLCCAVQSRTVEPPVRWLGQRPRRPSNTDNSWLHGFCSRCYQYSFSIDCRISWFSSTPPIAMSGFIHYFRVVQRRKRQHSANCTGGIHPEFSCTVAIFLATQITAGMFFRKRGCASCKVRNRSATSRTYLPTCCA